MSAGKRARRPRRGAVIARPFGAESRAGLLTEYFDQAGAVTVGNAWQHIYRLLLWIDRTTGLSHCYESDKSQPGRPWYARSLAFHAWVSEQLGVPPAELAEHVDWLFCRGTELLATAALGVGVRRATLALQQQEAYRGLGFPTPGEDPVLDALIREELAPWLSAEPPSGALVRLTERIRSHFSAENRRKNLLGEGFEDVLAFTIRRLPGAEQLDVRIRPLLHELPGFRPPAANEKRREVDLAILAPGGRRILVSAKWSVRADREEQFGVDFDAYARLESAGQDFDFVFVTNEFDAARLVRACERRQGARTLFNRVVHLNPLGPLAVYEGARRGASAKLRDYVSSGRLSSLDAWLRTMTGGPV